MRDSDGKNAARSPPRKGRNSHSEQTDEAPGLIDKEQVEVERVVMGAEGTRRRAAVRLQQHARLDFDVAAVVEEDAVGGVNASDEEVPGCIPIFLSRSRRACITAT